MLQNYDVTLFHAGKITITQVLYLRISVLIYPNNFSNTPFRKEAFWLHGIEEMWATLPPGPKWEDKMRPWPFLNGCMMQCYAKRNIPYIEAETSGENELPLHNPVHNLVVKYISKNISQAVLL